MNLMFVECILISPNSRGFSIKLPSIECVTILLKFRGSFVKLIFTKFGYFVKFKGVFCKM